MHGLDPAIVNGSEEDARIKYGHDEMSELFQIDFENRHGKIVGKLSVFLIAEDDADELVTDIDFSRVVLLGALSHADRGKCKRRAQIFGQLGDFIGLQDGNSLEWVNAVYPQSTVAATGSTLWSITRAGSSQPA
jgi:hypothetical protein